MNTDFGRVPLGPRWMAASVCAVLAGTLATVASHAEQRALTLSDIARIRTVGSAAISPDGRSIAYTLDVPRAPWKKTDGGYEEDGPAWRELHLVDVDGRDRPYVAGRVNVGAVQWIPGGRGISFLAKRGIDKHESLYVIPVDGGEARRTLQHETDISGYTWSPDGRRLAFLAQAKPDKKKKDRKEQGFTQEVYEEDWKPTRVWIASPDAPDDTPAALDLPGSASAVLWSPAGSHLAVALAPTPSIDDRYMNRKVHIVDVDTREIVTRLDAPGKLGQIAWSPDGRYLAVIAGVDRHDPSPGHLMVAATADGKLRDLLPDYPGHIHSIAWQSNDIVMFLGDEGVWTAFSKVRRNGTGLKRILDSDAHVLHGLTLSRDGLSGAFVGDAADHPAEVFTMHHGDAGPRRLTDSNPWLAEIRLARQEPLSYKARDGLELQGILIQPLDELPKRRYPLVLIIHGGPESHVSNGWVTRYSRPGQVLAARGFAVFYPNYRGSTGRGVAFSKLSQADYGGKEFDDLVDAVDHLAAMGLADKDRVGVTGGSYGGFASAWCATYYTERFAASVMFVGISDQVAKFGTTDIPNEMHLVHALRWPWEDWDWFRQRSPVYHVDKARTPILILHGKNDPRVHPSQSLEMYRYLKTLGKTPVRLVLYPGEGHGNRKAAARFDYSLRLIRWMEHYLKGPGGDPPPYELDCAELEETGDTKRSNEDNAGRAPSSG